MSFDPMAAAIDWLDAYRSSDLETIMKLCSDDVVIDCACCAMATIAGNEALRTYWTNRFLDCVPSDLEDLQPSADGATISYHARDGIVVAALQFNPEGQIALLRTFTRQ